MSKPRNARFALLSERYERDVLPQLIDQRRYAAAARRLGLWFGVQRHNINEYAVARARYVGNATIRREIGVYMAIINHARRVGLIDYTVSPPRIPTRSTAEGLTSEEVGEIVARAEAHADLYRFVMIALNTGARPGAILGLTWDRVNFTKRTIDFHDPRLSKQARRKGRAVVPINQSLMIVLGSGSTPAGLNVDCRVGRVVPIPNINHLWRRHIGFSRPHDLRHTVATEIARRHGLLAAAAMLGHKSIKTTEQVYVHIQADQLRHEAETLGKIHVGNDQSRSSGRG
jgi:integrase